MGNMVKVTAEVNACTLGQGQIKYLVKIGRIEIILGLGLRHPNIRIENNPRIRIGRIILGFRLKLGLD